MCAGGDIAVEGCQAELEAFTTCVNTKIIPPGT
jgi:hypothetical protein